MTASCMILAAGRGSRLKELTAETPKPLVPVAGVRPLLRTLDLLHRSGHKSVVMNTSYLAEKLESVVGAECGDMHVMFSRETERLETGGGVKNALHLLHDDAFLVINGDVIWAEEETPILPILPKLFDPETMDALLLVVPRESAHAHTGKGDFFIDDDSKLAFRGEAVEAPYVYTGIQVLHPKFFDDLPHGCYSLVEGYRKAATKGRLYGLMYSGCWVDMGTPEGMEAAGKLLQRLGAAVVAA